MNRAHRSARGFSLVELMTAMLLSLLLMAAAVSVFVSNKRVYGATEGLSRIQESARIAFELMSRDIREAGGNPCDVRMKVVNVLTDAANWWAIYDDTTHSGLTGFDDGDFADSVDDTDAIQVQFFEDTGLVTSAGMTGTTGALTVDDVSSIADQQILMACGFFPSSPTEPVTDTAAIFSAGISGSTITHATASGNSSSSFSNATHPTAVVFPANTLVGRLRAMEWYVGENATGRNSLFRRQVRFAGGGAAPALGDPEEVVDDVTDLQLSYLENGTWTDSPGSWNAVTAVQVELEFEEADSRPGGVQDELIKRRLTHVIALRNKL